MGERGAVPALSRGVETSVANMEQPLATRALRVGIPEGLHMRAAMEVAKLLGRFDSHVVLVKADQRVDGRDVLQILSLAAVQHEELTAEASGSQAEEALAALAVLFENDFAEETTEEMG